MLLSLLLPFLLLTADPGATPPRDAYPKHPGIDIEHYRFEIALSDVDDTLRADAEVRARFLTGGDSVLRLDLAQATAGREGRGMTVQAIRWGDRELLFRHAEDQLFISLGRATLAGELVVVRISYRGRPADALRIGPNMHGDRTIFSDNWPNRAHHWLPTVDHPYDKATSEMVVIAPSHYQVVSNGLLIEETDLGEGQRRTHWKQSVPIATWLYVLGVAEFAVEHRASCLGVPIQTWVYRQDREAGFHDFAEPTCDAMTFFNARVGPYSYEKLANIVSPSVGGGMEAASAILYGERSVSGTRAINWQNVIVHELAHQWFGNAVTEDDWNDVWLSEGFATYFTLLYREHARGRDDFVTGLRESRERILAFYTERPDYRVVHANLTDMAQVTTGMTYQKGAWTLHMLRQEMGDEAFWRGIQAYHRRYRDRNATTAGFRQTMEEVTGRDFTTFFREWLYQGGIPTLEVSWRHDEVAEAAVITVRQPPTPYAFHLAVDLDLVLADGSRARTTVEIGPDGMVTTRVPLAATPVEVIVDPDTRLLGRWTIERNQ